MVAFPGESEDDYRRTLEAIEKAEFSGLHVFRFSPRPRTAAARYQDRLPAALAQERSAEVIQLGHRLKAEYERRFVGKHLEVIWDRTLGGQIRGLSENYIQVSAPVAGRRAGQLERFLLERTA
jgi:threonylcarbamoyladenosine tRNA methylthiotransferase MtaB